MGAFEQDHYQVNHRMLCFRQYYCCSESGGWSAFLQIWPRPVWCVPFPIPNFCQWCCPLYAYNCRSRTRVTPDTTHWNYYTIRRYCANRGCGLKCSTGDVLHRNDHKKYYFAANPKCNLEKVLYGDTLYPPFLRVISFGDFLVSTGYWRLESREDRLETVQYRRSLTPLWDHIIHNSYLSYQPTAYLSPERITQIKTHCPTHTTYHHSIYHHVLNEYWRYKQMVGRKQGHKANEADSWYRWGGRWRT